MIKTMKRSPNNVAGHSDRRVKRHPHVKSDKTVTLQEGTGPRKRPKLKSSSRRVPKLLLTTYVLAIIWTSLAYAVEYTRSRIPASMAMLKASSTRQGRLAVRAYVQSAAKTAGVNPRIAEWIVSHESRHHPEATGDGGESRGLWQINKAWHPEVSDACAYDVTCSTNWSLERIRAGYLDEWSTWKYCKARFEDCPF
jgi:hypothetical protein